MITTSKNPGETVSRRHFRRWRPRPRDDPCKAQQRPDYAFVPYRQDQDVKRTEVGGCEASRMRKRGLFHACTRLSRYPDLGRRTKLVLADLRVLAPPPIVWFFPVPRSPRTVRESALVPPLISADFLFPFRSALKDTPVHFSTSFRTPRLDTSFHFGQGTATQRNRFGTLFGSELAS